MNKVNTWKQTFIGLCGILGVAIWPAVAKADCDVDCESDCIVYGPDYPCNCDWSGCDWCESWTIDPICEQDCEDDYLTCVADAADAYGASYVCGACIVAADFSFGALLAACVGLCGLAAWELEEAWDSCTC
jgi:hypothetical protein